MKKTARCDCFVEFLKHVDVSANQRRLGDDSDRLAKLSADFQTLPRQLVVCFERNVRIGSKRENYLIALPRRLHQLLAQQLRRVDLDDDLAIEVGAGAVAKILVSRAAETIGATVNAAAITIDGVIKANVRAVVVRDDLARLSFFEDFELRFGRLAQPFD